MVGDFSRRVIVLKKYVAKKETLQLEVLYAFQIAVAKLLHPPSECTGREVEVGGGREGMWMGGRKEGGEEGGREGWRVCGWVEGGREVGREEGRERGRVCGWVVGGREVGTGERGRERGRVKRGGREGGWVGERREGGGERRRGREGRREGGWVCGLMNGNVICLLFSLPPSLPPSLLPSLPPSLPPSFPPSLLPSPGLLYDLFSCCYLVELVDEQTFHKWRDEGKERFGKRNALQSVAGFFDWLLKAEQESDTDT